MHSKQLLPRERITRIRIFDWLMVDIHQSRSVNLIRIAGKIPDPTRLFSIVCQFRLINITCYPG